MKKTVLATLVALACAHALPAAAADYYLVLPVLGKTVNRAAIQVSLSAGTLPAVLRGDSYAYDFKPHLQVTGDTAYAGSGVKWTATGTLPPGLSLDASTGVLSGVPTTSGSWPFTVSATYSTKIGQQTYQVAVTSLTVTLDSATPPQAVLGTAYAFNLNSMLKVDDPGFTGQGVSWQVVSNTLPSGLQLSVEGIIAGTPTATGTGAVRARASYRGFAAEQTYTVTSSGSRILTLSPAVNGRTSWNLDADGPLVLSTAGTWTITPASTMTLSTKLWGAGGGGGGIDAAPVYSGKGGGGAYVAGQYQATAKVALTAVVGGGGGAGGSSKQASGGGLAGANGGGTGGNAGAVGTSGAGGGGGGRTELLAGTSQLACAGGGGGGGGDGNSTTNGGNDGNYTNGTTSTKTGGTPTNRQDDGGGNGGGGGGCNGGAASANYPSVDSNGEGGAAGNSTAPMLTSATITKPTTGGTPANASDADLGSNARGGANALSGTAAASAGTPGVLVIR